MRSTRLALAIAAILLYLCTTPFQKTGHAQAVSCTVTAADASLSAVQSAVNAAASGAVVCVPAGTVTWTGTLAFPSNKDLTLAGAGVGQTVVNCGITSCWSMSNASSHRLTGFDFNWSAASDVFLTVHGPVTNGKRFRIDHNRFNAPNTTWSIIDVSGDGPTAKHPTGVIDNNVLINFSLHFNGTNFNLTDGNTQHALWSQPTALGDFTDVVYVEDNSFTSTIIKGFQNFADGNYAARWVWRFNTHNGHGTGLEAHSVQGGNRAVRRWEVYGNSWTKNASSFYPVLFLRGGSGVVFDNTASTQYGETETILLDNVRSMGNPGDGVGACDGTSNWDQNTSGQNGYACRDQIGRGPDAATWSPGQAFTQPLLPAYFFNNFKGTSQFSTTLDGHCGSATCLPAPGNNPAHIVANRDFYNYNASFDGSSGVGRGTLAGRPSACTAGVGYWATDVGEWNSRHAGADGQLYKCTAANTWSLYYTPYQYPHPMTLGSGTVPSAPSNVRIIGG
jgi:hypothetical protein